MNKTWAIRKKKNRIPIVHQPMSNSEVGVERLCRELVELYHPEYELILVHLMDEQLHAESILEYLQIKDLIKNAT